MKQQRKQVAGQSRLQKRVRARLRTERMRDAYDEADLQGAGALMPGEFPTNRDPERECRPVPEDESEPSPQSGQVPEPRLKLEQILRSRSPTVPLHLVERDGSVEVVVVAAARSQKVREAYEELAGFLRFVFAARPAELSDEDWQRLLWGRDASPEQRLVLLTRLAISADTRIDSAAVPFTPNDRSLKRFQAKFAALPDGTAFSLRLLLRDQRGKRGGAASGGSGLLTVPDPLLLLAVRNAFAVEAGEKRARSDYEIGPLLHQTLLELGVALTSAPTEEEVRTVRERRQWKKLGLFPKAAARQKGY